MWILLQVYKAWPTPRLNWSSSSVPLGITSMIRSTRDRPGYNSGSLSNVINYIHWDEQNAVNWSTWGMCVLSLIYSYVAVCRFCAGRYLITICYSLLFSNYSTHVFFLYIFMLCFMFSMFVFYFVCSVSAYCFVYCFSFCIQLSLYYFCTSLPTTATGWKHNCNT